MRAASGRAVIGGGAGRINNRRQLSGPPKLSSTTSLVRPRSRNYYSVVLAGGSEIS
jgi:hypothetical protein